MRQFSVVLIAVTLSLALTGCPFFSRVPIGAPKERAVDESLCGEWVFEKATSKQFMVMTVLPFSEQEYYVEMTYEGGDRVRLRGIAVQIGEEDFIELNSIEKLKPLKYFLVRIDVDKQRQLVARPVGERVVPKELDGNPDGLKTFIMTHLNDAALDDEDGPFVFRRPSHDETIDGRLRSWNVPTKK